MFSIQYAHTFWCLLYYMIALQRRYLNIPILMQKFDVDGAFKQLGLYLSSAIKMIITFRSLAYISLQSTFSGKLSYSNFSLLAKPMCDVMNKVLNTNRLAQLSTTSPCIDYHDKPILLPDSIPFAKAPDLLFPIALNNEYFVDLYIDGYINICLDRKIRELHESTRCFNIITNMFDIFFSRSLKIPNGLKQSYTLLLRKLHGERTPAEVKKLLR